EPWTGVAASAVASACLARDSGSRAAFPGARPGPRRLRCSGGRSHSSARLLPGLRRDVGQATWRDCGAVPGPPSGLGSLLGPTSSPEAFVTYIFMAVQYPEPGRLDDVYASMSGMVDSMAGTPGLIEIGPWIDRDSVRLVGVSRWASGQGLEAVMPESGVPNAVTHDGEIRPREYFHLIQPDPPS